MTQIKFNVPGCKRKELAKTIALWLGENLHYAGAPTFAYEIGRLTLDRNGILFCENTVDSNAIERLMQFLYDEGFESDFSTEDSAEPEASENFEISVPSDTANIDNLKAIIDSKAVLLRHAFTTDDISLRVEDEKITFPWFTCKTETNEAMAYMLFVSALCRMSKELKRVTGKEKEVPNEKYAFRCFLLRLGFIGNEYKNARKILLKNLSGNSAFKSGKEEE